MDVGHPRVHRGHVAIGVRGALQGPARADAARISDAVADGDGGPAAARPREGAETLRRREIRRLSERCGVHARVPTRLWRQPTLMARTTHTPHPLDHP